MFVKIEARILIFPGTDFYFLSTSVTPGTFLGSGRMNAACVRHASCMHVASMPRLHAHVGLCTVSIVAA